MTFIFRGHPTFQKKNQILFNISEKFLGGISGWLEFIRCIILLCSVFWHVLDPYIVCIGICYMIILPVRSIFAVLSPTFFIFMHTNLYLSLFCWYLDGAAFHHVNLGEFYVVTLKTFTLIFLIIVGQKLAAS